MRGPYGIRRRRGHRRVEQVRVEQRIKRHQRLRIELGIIWQLWIERPWRRQFERHWKQQQREWWRFGIELRGFEWQQRRLLKRWIELRRIDCQLRRSRAVRRFLRVEWMS